MHYVDELAIGLGYKDFKDYLQGNDWRKRKRSFFRERCECCGSKKELWLYHKTFVRLGKELDSDISVVCRTCYEKLQEIQKVVGQENAPEFLRNDLKKKKNRRKLPTKEYRWETLGRIANQMRGETVGSIKCILHERVLILNSLPTQRAFDLGFAKTKEDKVYWNKEKVINFVKANRKLERCHEKGIEVPEKVVRTAIP